MRKTGANLRLRGCMQHSPGMRFVFSPHTEAHATHWSRRSRRVARPAERGRTRPPRAGSTPVAPTGCRGSRSRQQQLRGRRRTRQRRCAGRERRASRPACSGAVVSHAPRLSDLEHVGHTIDVSRASLPGTPAVVIGSNSDSAGASRTATSTRPIGCASPATRPMRSQHAHPEIGEQIGIPVESDVATPGRPRLRSVRRIGAPRRVDDTGRSGRHARNRDSKTQNHSLHQVHPRFCGRRCVVCVRGNDRRLNRRRRRVGAAPRYHDVVAPKGIGAGWHNR